MRNDPTPFLATTRTIMKPILRATLAGAALLALAGCSSYVSRGIDADGNAQEVIFPDPQRDITLPEGTFPNLDNLRAIGPGVTKDQLYDLLGRPHFREGLAGVREWDYLFNFRSGGGITVCQYKVIFDTDYKGRSFHWKPDACAALLRPALIAVPAVPAPVPPPAPRQFSLSADALFAFDRSSLADLQSGGRAELDRLAQQLRGAKVARVQVVGHTDRLGTAEYNQRLSEARARTVADYLAQAGVPVAALSAGGRGAGEPKVRCGQHERAALIACLAPNRRVDITVQASGEASP